MENPHRYHMAGILAAGVVCLLLHSGVASAHHSFAMFDTDKFVTLKGTIKEVEWVNPHSWFWITTINEKTGEPEV